MASKLLQETIQRDIALLEQEFGPDNVVWPSNYSYVLLKQYPLPLFYSKKVTGLLLVVPPQYGSGVPLNECYVDQGIKVRMPNGTWRELPHYFEHGSLNKYTAKGWSWLCFYPSHWQHSDTVLSILKLIDLFLENPFKEF